MMDFDKLNIKASKGGMLGPAGYFSGFTVSGIYFGFPI
jgi:hypothetical protein